MKEQQSISDTLKVIRRALEEDDINEINHSNDGVLVLNKIVKKDGTVNIINQPMINKDDVMNLLDKKLDVLLNLYLEKWLNKKMPKHLEQYFKNKI